MKQKTYYHIILDQSGSMDDCVDSTISGFNEQLQVIQSLKERFPDHELYIGLTRFNNEVMHTYYKENAFSIKKLNKKVYIPNGTTALYDAIGTTVLKLKDDIQAELDADISAVVIVIITDGHENASRLFSFNGIRNLIKELEGTGKWTFSYLGATIDAVDIAVNLNIKVQNSMSFEKAEMGETYSKLKNSINRYVDLRSKGEHTADFLTDDNP
ncbi:MAG: vWA domain-containing protein [Ginsengibacter sp.]